MRISLLGLILNLIFLSNIASAKVIEFKEYPVRKANDERVLPTRSEELDSISQDLFEIKNKVYTCNFIGRDQEAKKKPKNTCYIDYEFSDPDKKFTFKIHESNCRQVILGLRLQDTNPLATEATEKLLMFPTHNRPNQNYDLGEHTISGDVLKDPDLKYGMIFSRNHNSCTIFQFRD